MDICRELHKREFHPTAETRPKSVLAKIFTFYKTEKLLMNFVIHAFISIAAFIALARARLCNVRRLETYIKAAQALVCPILYTI